MVNVVFVCLGNIGRSPSAEGVFRALVEREGLSHAITTDSAGTASFHTGQPPDKRAQATARNRGIDISDLRARQAVAGDFNAFDYVIAMDHSNHEDLKAICPVGYEARLRLFMEFAPNTQQTEVPDPYYGDCGFDTVLDMLETAAQGLLDHIRRENLVL